MKAQILTKKVVKKSTRVPTFLKWAGGKAQLLEQFSDIFPRKITTYIEPFLGGGATLLFVLKYRKPERAFAYDVNRDLIDVYQQIRNYPKEMIAELDKIQSEHNMKENRQEYYLQRREEYNYELSKKIKTKKSIIRKSALFIYLNKTCFNGLYRVNSKGEFNVPFGKYEKVHIFEESTILEASALLQKVKLDAKDYRKVRYHTKSTIYFDPPYWPEKVTGFTGYTKLDFGAEDQENLARLFKKLNCENRILILSNSFTPFIRGIYQETRRPLIKQLQVNARWVINCQGHGRKTLKELVVINYELNQKDLKDYRK